MKINRIAYTRSKRLPNGENERFEATAELMKGENPDMAFDDLKQYVKDCLGIKETTTMSEAFKLATESSEMITKGKL